MARAFSSSTATGSPVISTSNYASKYGFFLFPPLTAGGKQAAMSAPLTYGICRHGQARGLRRLLP